MRHSEGNARSFFWAVNTWRDPAAEPPPIAGGAGEMPLVTFEVHSVPNGEL